MSISGFEVGSAASASIVRAFFSLILVIFMFVSALTYLGALQGKDVAQMNMTVLGYFSGLLGFVVGLAATTFFPREFQFVGLLDYRSSSSDHIPFCSPRMAGTRVSNGARGTRRAVSLQCACY
ncbi:MAG TPA: hypothetical protein VFE98_04785 [Candidatus Bathyarchaeia archaeon]|nr:hypothetical protein [Candidatus Bathyarchaeia archaeon]